GACEFECVVALIEQLLADPDTLKGDLRVEHGSADVAGDGIAQVAHLFGSGLGAEVGFAGASRVLESIEDGDVDVGPGGAVPGRLDLICADRSAASGGEGGDGGAAEIVLGGGVLPGGKPAVIQSRQIGARMEGELDQIFGVGRSGLRVVGSLVDKVVGLVGIGAEDRV